jgi:hypothetical protein
MVQRVGVALRARAEVRWCRLLAGVQYAAPGAGRPDPMLTNR